MTQPDYTPGEVARALASLTRSTEALTTTVSTLASRDAADLERFKHHDARISALESWQTWAMRIVLAAVIMAVIGLVVYEAGPPA